MAINDAIITKIEVLKIKKADKQLLKDILAKQEHVSKKHYAKQYKEVIEEYLEKKK